MKRLADCLVDGLNSRKGAGHSGSYRVNRGGSWNNNARNIRCANRNRNTPDNRNNNLGFRVARSPFAENHPFTVPVVQGWQDEMRAVYGLLPVSHLLLE